MINPSDIQYAVASESSWKFVLWKKKVHRPQTSGTKTRITINSIYHEIVEVPFVLKSKKKKKEKKFPTKSNSFQEMYATYDWDLLINEYVFSLYSDTRATKDHL